MHAKVKIGYRFTFFPETVTREVTDLNIFKEVQRRLTERTRLLRGNAPESTERAIGFLGALKIPGVVEFSLSLFFSKLVSYTFLYWLPLYISHSNRKLLVEINEIHNFGIFNSILKMLSWSARLLCSCILEAMGATLSADLSTLFDVGGIIGAIAAGVISDHSGMSATTCVGMLAVAAPMVSQTLLIDSGYPSGREKSNY